MDLTVQNYYRDKKILVAGGLGFIGSNLVIRLIGLGARVTIIDSLVSHSGGNRFNIHDVADQVTVKIADVRDKDAICGLVQKNEIMFNLVGQVSHIDSMVDPAADLEINTQSQIAILQACRKYNQEIKVVYASTRQVYGKPEYLPVDEQHPLHPVDANGINKMAGEWYHRLYHSTYGIRTAILRLTNTYGPRQLLKHNRQGFMGWFMRQAVTGGEIELFGTGEQLRDLNYVEDVIDAMLLVGQKDVGDGKIYNLGHPEPVSLLAIAKMMQEISGKGSCQAVPFPEERKRIDIGDYYSTFAKFNRDTDWQPHTTLQDGLTKTIEFFTINRDKYL